MMPLHPAPGSHRPSPAFTFDDLQKTTAQTVWRYLVTGIFLAALFIAIGFSQTGAMAADEQGVFGRVIRIEREAFKPEAGLIEFHEVASGENNPVYSPELYGADAPGVTVRFGGYFEGQRLATVGQCPPGANPNGCVTGDPAAPLALAFDAPGTFTAEDSANPRSPSLSGSPKFNGPVSMVFDRNVAGVGLMGGFFDAVRSTAIQVYDRRGRLIGGVENIETGMEYLALVTEDGSEQIAGLQFSLVGDEPHGYGIDDLSFAFTEQIDRSQVPSMAALPETDAGNDEGKGSLKDLFENDAAERAERKKTDSGSGSLSDLFK